MAAASGPVQTSSGETVDADDSRSNNLSAPFEREEFKMPSVSTVKVDQKTNTNIVPTQSPDQSKKSSDSYSLPSNKSNGSSTGYSPAEHLQQFQLSIPYKEPIWSGLPPDTEAYSFDVLKNGTIIENIELRTKPWFVFGRLPSCDIFLEHPSLSRHHAVVQYCDMPGDGRERGWYLYDMDSTHGTWVNKVKVASKKYHRLHVGYVVKFGGSSRLYILQGPEADREPESEQSVSELKAQRDRLQREAELLRLAEDEELQSQRQKQQADEDRGCSWGMDDDAVEVLEENPFASLCPQHEHLYADDPKKALKGFYEREGYDLPDYQFSEVSYGKHRCYLELPVEGANGAPLVAEATVSGKKKDAVVACALEACRLLDTHGLLHAAKHESRKRKQKNWEDDDFYESDEDTFLDRTGTIEKKRLFRMKKSGKDAKAESYDTLLTKLNEVTNRITEIERKLQEAKAQADAIANEEEDALDAYMTAIKAGVMDTKTRLALKRELLTLRTEEQRLCRLANIAKPAALPELKKLATPVLGTQGIASGTRKIGAAHGPKKMSGILVDQPLVEKDLVFHEEEEDEEDITVDSVQPSSRESEKTRLPDTDFPCDKSRISASDDGQESSDDSAPSFRPSPKTESSPGTLCLASGETHPDVHVTGCKRLGKPPERAAPVKKHTSPPLDAPAKEIATKRSAPTKPEVPRPSTRKKVPAPASSQYDSSDPKYAVWLPPQDQTGDGRTSLNDKLGY